MGCGGSKDEKKPQVDKKKDQQKKTQEKKDKANLKESDKAVANSAVPQAAADAAHSTPQAEEEVAQQKQPREFSPADADLHEPEETATHDRQAPAEPLSPEVVEALEAQNRAVIEVEASEAIERTHITSDAVATSPTQTPVAATAATPKKITRRSSVSTPRGVTSQPRSVAVKRRPSKATTTTAATAAAPASTPASAPRAAPAAAAPAVGQSPSSTRGEVPTITITAVRVKRSADGEDVLEVIEDSPLGTKGAKVVAEPGAEAAAAQVFDPDTGKLIEQAQADPTWQVLRPPPQNNSSWQLLRQVRLVFNMRSITAI